MGAVTLWESARLKDLDPVSRAAQIAIARASMVFSFLPFVNVDTDDNYQWKTGYDLEQARGAYRALNEELTEGSEDWAHLQFALAILGDKVEIDRKMPNRDQAFNKKMAMKSEGLGFSYNEAFIKGSREADPRQFDGLQTIMEKQLPSSQTLTSATSGGEALSLSKLDAVIDSVRGANIIFCSASLARKFSAAGRDSYVAGFVNYEPNDPAVAGRGLGTSITYYNGKPIVPIKGTFNQDNILPYDEAASVGGALQTTSLYVARIGADGVYGAQSGGIEARNYGNVQGSVKIKGDVEWVAGAGVDHPLAVARYKDITDAPIVS
jgi:hypothetical protein